MMGLRGSVMDEYGHTGLRMRVCAAKSVTAHLRWCRRVARCSWFVVRRRRDGGERQSSHHVPPRPAYRLGAAAHGRPCGHDVIQDQHSPARHQPRVGHLQLPVESGRSTERIMGFHGFAPYVACSQRVHGTSFHSGGG